MRKLTGAVQNYAWGSTTLLSELRGEAPSSEPEAELWYGAHPKADSLFDDGTSLLEAINADPGLMVGDGNVAAFGPKLPFLLKLLAAGGPLSIQAHPSIEQAKVGFAAEEAAGIDRVAPERSFRDDNHKPELICALTPFDALVGFRPIEETRAFYAAIEFDHLNDQLADGPKSVVAGLLDPGSSSPAGGDVAAVVEALVEAAAGYRGERWRPECTLIASLTKSYPGDAGIGVASLLNLITLAPGEALYLGAGTLHAYVGGLGVELMANSDNVLRGGLTPKHIDIENLLDVVLPDTMTPALVPVDTVGRYQTPAPEFALHRIDLGGAPEVAGPSIVLCTHGSATVTNPDGTSGADETMVSLGPTDACWLAAGERARVAGEGITWLATVGAPTMLDNA